MFKRYSLPAIAWFLICTFLFTLPGSAFPKQTWLGLIHFDKWVHIGLFVILTTLICWAIYKSNGRWQKNRTYFIIVALLCIGYGIAIEFIQKNFIANRSFDIGDIFADAFGAVLGLLYCIKKYTVTGKR